MKRRVVIDAIRGVSAPGTIKIVDVDTGRLIPGIKAANVRIEPGAIPQATLELAIVETTKMEVVADFVAIDPSTGELKSISRIEWADGTVFDA